MSTISRKIREVRKRLGLTQAEFADRLQTTQGTVSRWEAGDQRPEIDFIIKISDLGGFEPFKLGRDDEEHEFHTSDWGKQVSVIGAIRSDYWSESVEWEKEHQFEVRIPTIADWNDLEIAGFVVQDDSADELYPKGSIVFAALVPGSIEPPNPHMPALRAALLQPKHEDLVIVQRRRPLGLVELTIRKFFIISGGETRETYLSPVATNPKYVAWNLTPSAGGIPAQEIPEVIGIIVASFRIDTQVGRFHTE
jgi:transcriptional regulator with XRE-family HTH domain